MARKYIAWFSVLFILFSLAANVHALDGQRQGPILVPIAPSEGSTHRVLFAGDQTDSAKSSYYRTKPAHSGNHFELGMGLVFSPDYHDAVQEALGGRYIVRGPAGWVDLDAGLAISVVPRAHFVPRVRVLYGSVEIQGYPGMPGSQKSNIILIPGAAGRYQLTTGTNYWYASAELGLVSPHSGLSQLELASGGIALGISTGFVFGDYEIEVGYLRVPVDVGISGDVWLGPGYPLVDSERGNFGGFNFAFRRLWHF
jgi:hypothetical protein